MLGASCRNEGSSCGSQSGSKCCWLRLWVCRQRLGEVDQKLLPGWWLLHRTGAAICWTEGGCTQGRPLELQPHGEGRDLPTTLVYTQGN